MAYLGRQPNTGVRSRYIFTATASQTTFSGSDDDGKTLKYEDAAYLDVFLNGVLLKPVTDYTATTKTSVVLTSAAAVSDIVEIVAYDIANIADTVSKANGGTFDAGVTVNGTVTADGLTVDTDTLYVDAANNRVGVGTASPTSEIHAASSSASVSPLLTLQNTNTGAYGSGVSFRSYGAASYGDFETARISTQVGIDDGYLVFSTANNDVMTEAARIDSSGNFLVGQTTASDNAAGFYVTPAGRLAIARNAGLSLRLNRLSSDGTIQGFYKDGANVGTILTAGGDIQIGTGNNNLYFNDGANSMEPRNSSGSRRDNAIDMGHSSARFDDIYATNGTIQTSDANEKQDIAELDEAERRVATAAKGLIRKYRWIDSVEEKGDDARIHVGILAQDLKAAFEAEGLDPGRYAMFISSTWWEADETYTDDEGVEQTRTNTYDTAEEAPEGAVERTRLGVRYNQLLAFIIGAM